MKITILGLGYLGLPLGKFLRSRGHEIAGTTTSVPKKVALEKEGFDCRVVRSPELPPWEFLNTDLLILNVPPSEGQPEWFRGWNLSETKRIIFVSSTSVLREASHSQVLRKEEDWLKSLGIPWLIVRPGGLVGHGRHPGKYLAGKKDLKGGAHPVNLIHVEDVMGFISTAIEENITAEVIELVSDEHHSRNEFYSEYCQRNNLVLPEFDPEDKSLGPIVSNETMKKYYTLKFPTMIGKSL